MGRKGSGCESKDLPQVVFGLAEGKVKVGQLKSNKAESIALVVLWALVASQHHRLLRSTRPILS